MNITSAMPTLPHTGEHTPSISAESLSFPGLDPKNRPNVLIKRENEYIQIRHSSRQILATSFSLRGEGGVVPFVFIKGSQIFRIR